jgi:gephyrin
LGSEIERLRCSFVNIISPHYSHITFSCHKAISSLLERHAPGIVHLLLSSSISHTPFAALSRPVAGTIGKTLVITLPGSTKAVKENIEALLPVLEHALSLIKGGSGDDVHKVLQGAEGDRHREVRDVNDRESNHSYRHGHVHEAPKPHTSSSGVPLAGKHFSCRYRAG